MKINPTRIQLKRLKARRGTVLRGHKLLKDKAEGTARRYAELTAEKNALRAEVEAALADAMLLFALAKAVREQSEFASPINAVLELKPKLIRLAETEKACALLLLELQKTRRRANALEFIMIPKVESAIKYIAMKLEEHERGNTVRLMKVKDIIRAQKS